jgi:uncharacterized protein
MHYVTGYLLALAELTADMAPYLLLGFLFAGLLKVFLPPDLMSRYLGKSTFRSVANASLLGVPLPLCSCGVLPAGISLYKNGASKGSSVSFLISTPQTGIDSILVTWSMLGLPFALLRPVAAFITGITGGVLTNKLEKPGKGADEQPPTSSHAMRPKRSLKTILHYAYVEMVSDIAKWLVIGLLIAALIAVLIPDQFFTEFKMNGILGMLVILVVSIPLYICATSSVPIAAVLLMKGISPGALLVFLMAGPATNAATMTVIGKNMGRKTLTIYLASLIAGAMLFGLVIDYFLPGSWFLPLAIMNGGHLHHLLPDWLKYGSAIVMTLLLIFSFYTQIIEKIKSKSQMKDTPEFSLDIPEMVIGVEGMTCAHCKARVESGLRNEPNVTNAVADIENNTVKLYGSDLDLDKLGKTIAELGYIYKGKAK